MRNGDGNDDAGNFAYRQQQQSSNSHSSQGNLQQQQQQEGEESMIEAISCDNQAIDMTDWDFSKSETT